jgi:hypothetical protein
MWWKWKKADPREGWAKWHMKAVNVPISMIARAAILIGVSTSFSGRGGESEDAPPYGEAGRNEEAGRNAQERRDQPTTHCFI